MVFWSPAPISAVSGTLIGAPALTSAAPVGLVAADTSQAPAVWGFAVSAPRSKLSTSARQEHRLPTSGMVKVTGSRRSVDQDEHVVVEHGLAACVEVGRDGAVDVDGDGLPARGLPVGDRSSRGPPG